MNIPPGTKLVSSWTPKPRRKTEYELRQMSHEARLIYEIENPKTDADKEYELAREHAGLAGADVYTGSFYDDGPTDDEDYFR